jgi:hypothetical protein
MSSQQSGGVVNLGHVQHKEVIGLTRAVEMLAREIDALRERS